MKKLLTILGAVSLTASASATVVACGSSIKQQHKDLGAFLSEVAKAIYLKDHHNYDLDYVLEQNLFVTNEQHNNFYTNNFAGSLYHPELQSVGYQVQGGSHPTDKDAIINLASVGQVFFSLDVTNEDQEGQVKTLITSITQMLGINLQSETGLETLEQTSDLLQILGSALDMKAYVGKTYHEGINQAIVGFINQVNLATNQSHQQYSLAEFDSATTSLIETLRTMSANEGFSLDFIIKNPLVLSGLIDVAKLTLVYLNQFISTNQITSGEITNAQVLAFRNQTISPTTVFDLKLLLNTIYEALLGANASQTGPIAIKNILKVLFVNHDESYYHDLSITLGDGGGKNTFEGFLSSVYDIKLGVNQLGLSHLFGAVINGLVVIDWSTIVSEPVVAQMLSTYFNLGNTASTIFGMIASGALVMNGEIVDGLLDMFGLESLPIPQELLNGIKNLLSSPNALNILWDQNILGPIFSLLAGINTNLSFSGLLTQPLGTLFGLKNLFGLDFSGLGNNEFESIQSVLQTILTQTQGPVKLDLQTLSDVFTGISDVLGQLPTTVLNDLVLEPQLLNNIFALLRDNEGLLDLFTFLKETAVTQKADLIKNVVEEFARLTVETTILSPTQYKFLIARKIITITIVEENNLYKIKRILVQ